MRIGIDLDGVVYNFTRAFTQHVGQCKPNLQSGDPYVEAPTWDWFTNWPMSRDEFILEMECAVNRRELFWEGDLYESGIPTYIKRLRRAGHTVHVVTHRFSGRASDATWYWLHSKGIWFDSIDFARDKTSVPTDVFIEDNIDNYNALEAKGVKAFLVTRTYNEQHEVKNRVASFGEFTERILNGEV